MKRAASKHTKYVGDIFCSFDIPLVKVTYSVSGLTQTKILHIEIQEPLVEINLCFRGVILHFKDVQHSRRIFLYNGINVIFCNATEIALKVY